MGSCKIERNKPTMPSHVSTGSEVAVCEFDVICEYSDLMTGFVGHTGLATSSATFPLNGVHIVDMGPPLRPAADMSADVVCTSSLNVGEIAKIKEFVERHRGEHEAVRIKGPKGLLEAIPQIYCVHPHQTEYRDQLSGDLVRMRFSCAGFVFEAYRSARLVLFDPATLPKVDLQRVKAAYPGFAKKLDDPDFRQKLGLEGDGPWPIMLCGYLANAMNRDALAIRSAHYLPQAGHEFFPP